MSNSTIFYLIYVLCHTAVDYWALGVIIYEMMFGSPPFSADFEMDLFKNILSGKINFPTDITLELKDIVKGLCTVDQSKRMGRTNGGVKVIMQHLWYSKFSWEALINKLMDAPSRFKQGNKGKNSNYQSSGTSKVCYIQSYSIIILVIECF